MYGSARAKWSNDFSSGIPKTYNGHSRDRGGGLRFRGMRSFIRPRGYASVLLSDHLPTQPRTNVNRSGTANQGYVILALHLTNFVHSIPPAFHSLGRHPPKVLENTEDITVPILRNGPGGLFAFAAVFMALCSSWTSMTLSSDVSLTRPIIFLLISPQDGFGGYHCGGRIHILFCKAR